MRCFDYKMCAVALAALLIFSPNASRAGDEKPENTLRWLINEPVTLMDLGMMRLRDDLREAAATLVDLGYTVRQPRVGTYYDARDRKINAYVSILEPYARPTEQTCLEVFERVLQHLSAKSPGGTGSVGWYLEGLFSHEGEGNHSRPIRMQEELLDAVRFEVTVLPPDPMRTPHKVQCSGRLDAQLSAVSVSAS